MPLLTTTLRFPNRYSRSPGKTSTVRDRTCMRVRANAESSNGANQAVLDFWSSPDRPQRPPAADLQAPRCRAILSSPCSRRLLQWAQRRRKRSST